MEGGNGEEGEVEREVEGWRRAGTGRREGRDTVDSFLTCAL